MILTSLKLAMIWKFAKYLYEHWLRDTLRKAIDDPENDWDDVVMGIVDAAFDMTDLNYEEAWETIKEVYAEFLRPPALAHVKGNDTPIDDWCLSLCDKVFEYAAAG